MPLYASRSDGIGGVACGCAPPTCHDLYGDELDVVIAGIASCGCVNIGTIGVDYFKATLSGVNGSFTATWDAMALEWSVLVGTVTFQQYAAGDSGCATPSGAPVVYDVYFRASCDENFFAVTVTGSGSPFGGGFSKGGIIDEVLTNNLHCAIPPTPWADGTVTISLP